MLSLIPFWNLEEPRDFIKFFRCKVCYFSPVRTITKCREVRICAGKPRNLLRIPLLYFDDTLFRAFAFNVRIQICV